jgi:hypothetical protein
MIMIQYVETEVNVQQDNLVVEPNHYDPQEDTTVLR